MLKFESIVPMIQDVAFILLIDDDDLFRGSIQKALRRKGHKVVQAANGREGVKIYCEQAPDLVITDLVMPDCEGLETILEIKSFKNDARIVAMSGGLSGAAMDMLDLARRMGAMSTIAKPFALQALMSVVDAALARSGATAVDMNDWD